MKTNHWWRMARVMAIGAALQGFLLMSAEGETATDAGSSAPVKSDPEAVLLLKTVGEKLASMKSLRVDGQYHYADGIRGIDSPFDKELEIAMMRDAYIRVETITGVLTKTSEVDFASDGRTVWRTNRVDFIMDKQPVREENFHLGQGTLIQYFFSPKIEFNPVDRLWLTPISVFDTNKDAYNKNVTLSYLGERAHLGEKVRVIQLLYSTSALFVKQRFYINEQNLISQIDTDAPGWFSGRSIYCEKFRNYRVDETMKAEDFVYKPTQRIPERIVDPVRLGEIAPDFELPLNTGETVKMTELLKGKKGLLVVALDCAPARGCKGPDYFLATMRIMQQIRDKFGKQGLEVLAIAGADFLVPESKNTLLNRWMPDQTRFSYPIALDLDLERGIQGSAFRNFQLNGRNNILLDKDGRVVFACRDFGGLSGDRKNETALYQALGNIGFAVSPADMELQEFDETLYRRPGR